MDRHKIILVNRQALGDVVVLTALVRDIQRCYPGKFFVRQATTFSESVWANNPDLASVKDCPAPPNSRVIKMHYGDQMGMAKNGVKMHFLEGFLHYFNQTVGGQYDVNVKLTEAKPALYLSDKEKETRPVFAKNDKAPYWVLMAGSKSDMTTKRVDKNAHQKVVDILTKQGIRIVQCGARQYYNPQLDGVHNLVGKTDTRQFINIIAHSEGVICPITAAMHIAAAFDKPSVVIAGGRESVWWEGYPNSTYLHTIGKIHCADKIACHACTTSSISRSRCKDFLRPQEDGNAITVARCMHAITPKIITDAVMSYY